MSLSPLKTGRPSPGFRRRNSFPYAALFSAAAVLALVLLVYHFFFGLSASLRAGEEAWASGNYAQARDRFEKVVERHPDSALAYDGLGMVLDCMGDSASAQSDYAKASGLGLKPSQAFDHAACGDLLFRQGRAGLAEPEFQRELDLHPGSTRAELGLAECSLSFLDLDRAIAGFQQVLQSDPKNKDAADGLEKAQQEKEYNAAYYIYDRNNQPLARETRQADGTWKKSYPLAQYAAHIIGADTDLTGKTGLERDLAPLFPQDNVVLTLDANVQRIADQALGWKKGAVVVLDPATGEILAAVDHPSFNPDRLRREWSKIRWDPNHPLQNRAWGTLYQPGSICKIVTAAAALEAHIDLSTIFPVDSNGSMQLDGKTFWDWKRLGKIRSLKQALDMSSNIALAEVGFALGADRLHEYDNRFGFNTPDDLGFDIPGLGEFGIPTATSLAPMPADTRWALAERACGLGEDYRVTPLHAAMLAAAVANDGVMMRPMLVKEVRNAMGQPIFVNKPRVERVSVQPKTAAQLRSYMLDAVQDGIAYKAKVNGIEVAGKTGTSRTIKDKPLDAWFICFAPADKPKVAVAVLGDQEGKGMDVAAPIAKAVLSQILK